MELIGAVFIASLAYVYAPVLRVHAAQRTRTPLPAGAVAPDAEPLVVPPVELPEAVEKWCGMWSEDWSQDEARERARELYAQLRNWDVVLQELERGA